MFCRCGVQCDLSLIVEKLSLSRRAIWHPVSLMWFIVLMLVFIFSGRSLRNWSKDGDFSLEEGFFWKGFCFLTREGLPWIPLFILSFGITFVSYFRALCCRRFCAWPMEGPTVGPTVGSQWPVWCFSIYKEVWVEKIFKLALDSFEDCVVKCIVRTVTLQFYTSGTYTTGKYIQFIKSDGHIRIVSRLAVTRLFHCQQPKIRSPHVDRNLTSSYSAGEGRK